METIKPLIGEDILIKKIHLLNNYSIHHKLVEEHHIDNRQLTKNSTIMLISKNLILHPKSYLHIYKMLNLK